ncbi:hypothetical protein CDAR_441751 [Caerostris darwini]|uniref:Uncharacterized protein n=1 Tax=Caerostris darwini TaxID=1538125 RepID=A0AAV4VZ99_9ARAC|nr:hypothetical protein CDAR_441751 [Caerostris darwini]
MGECTIHNSPRSACSSVQKCERFLLDSVWIGVCVGCTTDSSPSSTKQHVVVCTCEIEHPHCISDTEQKQIIFAWRYPNHLEVRERFRTKILLRYLPVCVHREERE